MDLAICTIDQKSKTIEYAGARNPLLIIENNNMHIYKANKHSIGGDKNICKHTISYEHGALLYLYSDGFQDQSGGSKDRKYLV